MAGQASYEDRLLLQKIADMRRQLVDCYAELRKQIEAFQASPEMQKSERMRRQFFEICDTLGLDPLAGVDSGNVQRFYQMLAVRILSSFTEYETVSGCAARLRCTEADVLKALGRIREFSQIKIAELDGRTVMYREENQALKKLFAVADKARPYKRAQLRQAGVSEQEVSALAAFGYLAVDSQCAEGGFNPDYYIVM